MNAAHADVVIVGAGASGGVVARRLAEAGIGVVALEQGGWPDRGAYRGAEPDWELTARRQWSSSPNVRKAPADYPVDVSESDLGVLNFNGVGGGMILYAAQWPRLLPSDFRVRSLDGVADDWPIGYDALAPYYERTDAQIGVSGLGGNPAYPPGADPPLPPLPVGRAGMLLARAHDRLGWHWWPDTNAILSAPYEGRHQCVQRGTCMQGCGEGAKASTDLTHWPQAIAAGARLVTGARVRRIVTDRRGLARGAEWVDAEGHEHLQTADLVLCAANGIGTARLLLASATGTEPDGLANSSGLVGRRLMLHPLTTVLGIFDDELESWRGQKGSTIQSLQFYETDETRGFVRGARWALGGAGGPLGAALANGGTWGAGHHRAFRERFGHTAQWGLIGEDLPDEDNRVELSPDLVDSSGIAAPKVVYRIPENTRRLMEWNIARTEESLREAGAHAVEVNRYPPNGHFMGTARMGTDPATSVVDEWGIAHDVANLGIVDGSIFVTAGAANPTSTICALALRAADHLVGHRAEFPTPEQPRVFAAPTRAVAPAFDGVPVSLGPPPGLSDTERARFAALAEALIPADTHGSTAVRAGTHPAAGMPAASEVGVGGELLDRVLAARPDLAPLLRRALAEPVGEAPARLAALADSDRPAAHAVELAVAGGYYLHPDVRARIGYPGQTAQPASAFDYPEYLSEGLLDRVLERGFAARGRESPDTRP
jgi:choline dehydrogenase-like flavoprotein